MIYKIIAFSNIFMKSFKNNGKNVHINRNVSVRIAGTLWLPIHQLFPSPLPLNIVGGMYEVWTHGSHVKTKNFKENDPDT